MIKYPNYRRNESSPGLSRSGPGIAISCPPVVRLGTDPVFALHGSLEVPKKEAARFRGHLLQAVVILLRGPYPAVLNVGSSDLLFPDDLEEAGENIRGFFSLDLFDFFNLLQVPNSYFVSASIFRYLSDVMAVDVVK